MKLMIKKFKIGGIVRIPKYKNIFAKGYIPNWCEEVFVITKVENTVPWTYVISDLKSKETAAAFYEKKLQKTNQKDFRVQKIFKRKSSKLYVKWKGYKNSLNTWIDKKDNYKWVNIFQNQNLLKEKWKLN